MADESTAEPPETSPEGEEGQPEPESFPRSYVEDLRRESAGYRERAKRADVLAERLLAATVASATAGIRADPTDLPASDALLDDDGFPDAEAITAAARSLVERKPHLGDRRPTGTVDQGARESAETINLAGMIRGLAS
jgi:hypothetical protein